MILFVFFVYVLMFIHFCRRDTAILLSVSKFNISNDSNRYCIKITSYFTSVIWNIACNLYSLYFPELYFWWI